MDKRIDLNYNKEIDFHDYKNPDDEVDFKEEKDLEVVESIENYCKKVYIVVNVDKEEKIKEDEDFLNV